jgi:pilus assembly protein CpaF
MTYEEIKAEICEEVRANLDLSREMENEEVKELIYRVIAEYTGPQYLSLMQKETLGKEIFASLRELDILQELVDDDTITEIMVNGTDGIFVERNGRLTRWKKKFWSRERLEDIAQQIVGRCNRIVNESVPIVDARLDNGA